MIVKKAKRAHSGPAWPTDYGACEAADLRSHSSGNEIAPVEQPQDKPASRATDADGSQRMLVKVEPTRDQTQGERDRTGNRSEKGAEVFAQRDAESTTGVDWDEGAVSDGKGNRDSQRRARKTPTRRAKPHEPKTDPAQNHAEGDKSELAVKV